jgi:hypothetical protein
VNAPSYGSDGNVAVGGPNRVVSASVSLTQSTHPAAEQRMAQFTATNWRYR